jgi:hypothetical protein
MNYEEGMSIRHDAENNKAVVTFRGITITLSKRYDSQQEAEAAGEYYCRQLGWKD